MPEGWSNLAGFGTIESLGQGFSQIADHAPVILWTGKPDGTGTSLSRGWFTYTGQVPHEALGSGWWQAVHPDDRDSAARRMAEGYAKQLPFTVDLRLRRHDGEYRWVQAFGNPTLNEQGEYIGYVGSIVDIHDRKLAEVELERVNHKLEETVHELQTLIDIVPGGIATADPDCERIVGNQAFYSMFGLQTGTNLSITSSESGLPSGTRVMRDGKELTGTELPMQKSGLTGERVMDFDHDVVFPDGRTITLLANTAPLKDRQGRIRGVIGAYMDITRRKLAEDALVHADRSKDGFLAVLGHELRNPLAPLTLALQIIERARNDPDKVDECIAMMKRQLRHLTLLVNDLLDVSRISTGKITLRKDAVDLSSVVRHAIETNQVLLDAKQHGVQVIGPDVPIMVQGDYHRLAQVIGNLVNNAVKYTDAGGSITVTSSIEGDSAVIRVHDNGIGIAPHLLGDIFDWLMQTDRSLDRSQGGLGVGLTLSKYLVELHGGSIQASSAGGGRGSEFVVSLPLS